MPNRRDVTKETWTKLVVGTTGGVPTVFAVLKGDSLSMDEIVEATGEDEANLIAAAPDLYRALENILEEHRGYGVWYEVALSALAKAKGR
jgi:hypothetical protein